MACTNCGKDTDRLFWRKTAEDDYLCESCFSASQGIDDKDLRNSIARIIKAARHVDKHVAIVLINDLRGTGVPINTNRKGKKV